MTYKIIRNFRQKSIRLRIDQRTGEVIVSAPILYPKKLIENFISKNQDWITQHQICKKTFKPNDEIYVYGKKYTLCLSENRCHTHIDGHLIIVGGEIEHFHRRIKDFLKKKAMEIIHTQTLFYAQKMNIKFKNIRIRDTVSRWGSCSVDGNLSFCWRLILTYPEVLDYVVIHELAHIKYMNHGRDFWTLVSQYCPQYKQRNAQLKKDGIFLQQYL